MAELCQTAAVPVPDRSLDPVADKFVDPALRSQKHVSIMTRWPERQTPSGGRPRTNEADLLRLKSVRVSG